MRIYTIIFVIAINNGLSLKAMKRQLQAPNRIEYVHKMFRFDETIPLRTKEGDSFLMVPICAGNLSMFESYIKNGHKVDNTDKSPLIAATYKGYKEIVQMLFPFYTDPYAYSCALIAAASQGRLDIAQLLLEKGADPRVHEDRPLKFAIQNNHIPLVELLLKHGACQSRALLWAQEMKKEEIIKLLEHESEHNQKDKFPMHN